MRNEVAIFLLAIQFLTRLPVPASDLYSPERLNATPRYYPLVGGLLGAMIAAVFWGLSQVLPTNLALVLTMTIGLLLTGAFHEDGLADTFDGIGGGHDRDTALTIMKDSRLGTYGTAALVMALALKFASLIALPDLWIIVALISGQCLSRLSSVLVIATSRYARTEGKAKPVAESLSGASLVVVVLTGIGAVAAAACFLPLSAIGVGLVGATAGHIGMRLLFERKLGGYTGDTLGAVQQASEMGFYLGLVAWLS